METLKTMTYERDGRVARITLDRPERGNGITLEMPRELSACVERANLDPQVHVLALPATARASAAATTWSPRLKRMREGFGAEHAPQGSRA